jgi:outer membrane protein G
MKKLILLVTLLSVSLINAQAFKGSGDNKFQVGTSLQSNATGINVSYDFGIGENMSIGISSSYALGLNEDIKNVVDVNDRFDVKARFSANLGNVINIDEKFDVYPGLNLSLKNFGGHLGMRYFFSEGFGLFTEFNVPLAKYNTDVLDAGEELFNQFTINLGVSFNL